MRLAIDTLPPLSAISRMVGATRSMRVAGGLGTVARVVGDAQEIYDQRLSATGDFVFGIFLIDLYADINTGHVVYGQNAHRHAEILEGAIDLLRRGALEHQQLILASVGVEHAVAHETKGVADDDAERQEKQSDPAP